eukprot:13427811-Alexandrium_andersonii.AAC.1
MERGCGARWCEAKRGLRLVKRVLLLEPTEDLRSSSPLELYIRSSPALSGALHSSQLQRPPEVSR